MPAAEPFTLTQEQHDLIRDAGDRIPAKKVEEGNRVRQMGGVTDVRWIAAGQITQAKVGTALLYRVLLTFTPRGVQFQCECGTGGGPCVHMAAFIAELEQRPVADAPGVTPPDGTLLRELEQNHGKALPKSAAKFVQSVETWYARGQRSLAGQEIGKALGSWHLFGYYTSQTVELYPPEITPQSAMEYFLCVLLTLQAHQIEPPLPLRSLVDEKLERSLAQRLRRISDIKTWRKTLHSWQEHADEEPAVAPELRLRLHHGGAEVQIRRPGEADFVKAKATWLKDLGGRFSYGRKQAQLDAGSALVLDAACDEYGGQPKTDIPSLQVTLNRTLAQLAGSRELFTRHVVNSAGEPLEERTEPLRWELKEARDAEGDYQLLLVLPDGRAAPPPVAILQGATPRYVTPDAVCPITAWPFGNAVLHWPQSIPAAALESTEGVRALGRLGLPVPRRLAGKVKLVKAKIEVRAKLHRYDNAPSDYLMLHAQASYPGTGESSRWTGVQWSAGAVAKAVPDDQLVQLDSTSMAPAAAWLRLMALRIGYQGMSGWLEQRITGRDWPDRFTAWLDARPDGVTVELDAELASLRDGTVAGSVRLELAESKSGIDWFDLTVAMEVTDHTLTKDEIALLLQAQGRWVRLEGKGWRKLQFDLPPGQEEQLADLGLSSQQLTGEKQRLHALQLAGLTKQETGLLSPELTAQLRQRLERVETGVTPEVPAAITADLRPYQRDGFHFLAYLSTNGFGGVLADDMGLGKTLQALTWLAWLQGEQKLADPVLVVCPKSVQDNWRAEAARFFPSLPVTAWDRRRGKDLDGDFRLLVINYSQLRLHEDALREVKWGAIILDEAQAIKNPSSQSARAACALAASHRLALTGTPIENRLLDLWAIFAFAMPGILGNRASFNKNFDSKEDPLARRRLAARTRPFLLRRGKKEVAKDLPDRVEEDLIIEMEGTQAALYQAEIKRARAQLLKVKTSSQLDKLRFNILTSLLRLRQICCHPALVGLEDTEKKKKAAPAAESAKVAALMELLEQLMDEGQKVLVFSQFTTMLDILQQEITALEWSHYILTGQTENRGDLVRQFQAHEGPAVFLISLKAGGFGLNLTAASYVVLFDPWWNPAVEAQAIDRTHRIGQKQTVFAYRLLVKNSIEEKIRLLQKQKGALAQDILGEENFAKALTLSDFQFLLGEE